MFALYTSLKKRNSQIINENAKGSESVFVCMVEVVSFDVGKLHFCHLKDPEHWTFAVPGQTDPIINKQQKAGETGRERVCWNSV